MTVLPLANSECRNCFLALRDPAAALHFPSNNNNGKKFDADMKEEREKKEKTIKKIGLSNC